MNQSMTVGFFIAEQTTGMFCINNKNNTCIFGGGTIQTILNNNNNTKSIRKNCLNFKQPTKSVRRHKNNCRWHRVRSLCVRGGWSMKLSRATSFMFGNNMMRGRIRNQEKRNEKNKKNSLRFRYKPQVISRVKLLHSLDISCDGRRHAISTSQRPPRSKWHSASKSKPANLAHKPLTLTPTTTTTATTATATATATNQTALHPTTQANCLPATKRKVHTITITTSSEQTESIVLMIREAPQPQPARQTGLIELPIVEVHTNTHTPTMPSSVVPPPTFRKLTDTNTNLNLSQKTKTISNQKANHTTVVQIPKQSSKPRIFLLTRPAKPSLVRIVNPIAQHRQNSIAHHPQVKNGQEFLKTSKIKTIIARPSVPTNQTETVLKKNLLQVPQEDTQYPKITGYNSKPQLKRKLKDSLISNQEIIDSPKQVLSPQPSQVTASKQTNIKQTSTKQTSVKQTSIKQTSVKQTIPLPDTTVQAHYNLVKTTIETKEQPLQAAQMPLTLASMAGIELTGADMSHTAADMSGAMPPTATVEEINVPVFLDEYLQQAAAISTSAASVTTTTNNSNHIIYNNNNNNNNNISDFPESARAGSEAEAATEVEAHNGNNDSRHCLETFDNFEFDIDLLTENRNSDDGNDYHDNNQDKALELQLLQRQQQIEQQELFVQQQQQQQQLPQQTQKHLINDNSDQEVKAEKQKQQLQLMLDELLFINNNNNNSSSNSSCCNNSNNCHHQIILNTNSNINNNNDSISNTFKMVTDLTDNYAGEIEDIFKVGPNSPLFEENLSPPLDLGATTSSPIMENVDDYIPVVDSNNENSSYFLNSQPNVVMFSAGVSVSAPSSQNLNHSSFLEELLDAEPNTPPDMINYPYAVEPSCFSGYFVFGDSAQFIDEDTIDFNNDDSLHVVSPLKRSHPHATTPKHMQEKRMKLRLDIKPSKENENQSQELNTPAIINSILQNDEFNTCVMSPAENSTDIYNRLINSPYESVDKSEMDTGEYKDDITPPYTPYSLNSTSQQTNFTGVINSAPSSPASSIATTNATTSTAATAARRGRGRPAKLHSDRPDLSQIQSEADRKKALKRYKNNEASRKSRLKNKERDMAIEKEEKEQSMRSEKLELDLKELKKVERKLRQALKRQHFRGSMH